MLYLVQRIRVVIDFFDIFIGISNGGGDPTEILRLHQEIESYKKNIEESNLQIEKLVSNLCKLQAILDYAMQASSQKTGKNYLEVELSNVLVLIIFRYRVLLFSNIKNLFLNLFLWFYLEKWAYGRWS